MDAKTKMSGSYKNPVRIAVSAALLSVMLGGCSVVPDAVNPVKWYEKTTDFFSGDRQASDPAQAQTSADNRGLAADPNAPAPAPAPEQVAVASGGLSSDAASSNYASPPISRQGAPRDVLKPADTVALNTPPPPMAQPVAPVTPTQVAPPPLSAPQPLAVAEPPQSAFSSASAAPAPQANYQPSPISPPKRLSFADAPPPPDFNLPPTNANAPFGVDQFETVVISADGMQDLPATTRRLNPGPAKNVAQNTSAARFPEPGAAQGGFIADGNMARVATIHFADNSSNMDARDRSILGAVIQLQKERGGRVVVVGHASSRTRDMDYIRHKMVNFEISMKRATAIGNALKTRGLGADKLEVQAVSDAQPQYLEVMPSGEVGNRRVEIYLTAL